MKKARLNKQFDKRFGAFVRKKREERGWTQDELASRLGNNKQNVSRVEKGELGPSFFAVYKIAAAFEMTMGELSEEFGFRIEE